MRARRAGGAEIIAVADLRKGLDTGGCLHPVQQALADFHLAMRLLQAGLRHIAVALYHTAPPPPPCLRKRKGWTRHRGGRRDRGKPVPPLPAAGRPFDAAPAARSEGPRGHFVENEAETTLALAALDDEVDVCADTPGFVSAGRAIYRDGFIYLYAITSLMRR